MPLNSMAQHRSAGVEEPTAGASLLVERESVLACIDAALSRARTGQGRVVVLEAPSGQGKTHLLAEAERRAIDAAYRVLRSRSTPLELGYPFGAAMQLLEPVWLDADDAERKRLATGSAGRAGEWLDGHLHRSVEEDPFALIHALFCFIRALAAPHGHPQPLALLIDDAHWADASSLRFLAYLAQRLERLPVVVLVALRSGDTGSDTEALRTIASAPNTETPEVSALSADGVEAVVRWHLPDADSAFVGACLHLTAGNPLLLEQLLGCVISEGHAPDGETAERLATITPKAVLDGVVRRLSATDPDVVAVARAVAIIGDNVWVGQAAAVAGLPIPRAASAADTLAAAHLLHPGSPLAFVQPLTEAAVRESIPPLDRGRAHRRAAEVLLAGGVGEERAARHLLLAPPEGESWATDALRAAARRARAAGTPELAMRFLERAIAETEPFRPDAELLGELAETAAEAGAPDAVEQLRSAIDAAQDVERRLELRVTLANTLLRERRGADAARTVATALHETETLTGELRDDFDATLVNVARFEPGLVSAAAERGRELLTRVGPHPSLTQQRAIAGIALRQALEGEPAARIRELADLAGDAPVHAGEAQVAPIRQRFVAALVCADELERALELGDSTLAADPEGAGARGGARALALLEQGRVSEALLEAGEVLSDRPTDWTFDFDACAGFSAFVRGSVLAGQLLRADRALLTLDHCELEPAGFVPCLLEARARVLCAQRRFRDAIADAEAAGRMAEELSLHSPVVVPWRSTAGFAFVSLGEPWHARDLASEELELADAIGAPRARLRALRCLALAEGGREAAALLMQAEELLVAEPNRVEAVESLLALGAALRRSNQRSAAREPLERALAIARAGGAHMLEQTAVTELAATGARGRRAHESGVASLTASQRRVADLAVQGLTTRQMSDVLYVTPKTVEYHLRQIYRKLGVASRSGLAELLGE